MSYLSILSTFFYTSGGFLWLAMIAALVLAWAAYASVSTIFSTEFERKATRSVRKSLLVFISIDAVLMAIFTFGITGILIASMFDVVAPVDKMAIFGANIVIMTILLQGFAYISYSEAAYRLRRLDPVRSV